MYLRIDKIKLKDIGCYEQQEFDFKQGVNIITGPNGAGKSTIIKSIGIGLFGLNFVPLNKENIIRRGASSGKIEIEFSTHEGKYRSVQVIGKNRSWKVYKEGRSRPLTDRPNESKELIQNKLGGNIDKDTFKNAVFSEQGELTRLIDATDTDRKDQIWKILGLNRYNKAATFMSRFINIAEQKIERINSELKGMESLTSSEEIRNIIRGYEKEIRTINEEIDELREIETELQNQVDELDILEKSLSKLETSIREIKKAVKRNEDKVKRLIEDMKPYEEKLSLKNPDKAMLTRLLDQLENDRDDAYKRYQSLSISINNAENTRKNYQAAREGIERLDREIKELLEKKKQVLQGTTKDKLEESKKSLQGEKEKFIREKQKILSEIKQNETEKKRYIRDKNEITNKIVDLEKRVLEQFNTDLESLETLNKQLQVKINEKIDEISQMQDSINQLNSEKGKIEGSIDLYENTIKLLKDTQKEVTCPVCKRDFQDLDAASLIEEHRKTLSELKKKHESLREEIKEFKSTVNSSEKERKQLEEQKRKVMEIIKESKQLPEWKEKISEFENHMQEADTRIKELEKELEEYSKSKLDELTKKLENIQERLTDLAKITSSINAKSGEKEKQEAIKKELEQDLVNDDQIDAMRKEKHEKQEQVSLLEEKIKDLNELKNKLEQKLNIQEQLDRDKKRLENHRAEFQQLKSQYSAKNHKEIKGNLKQNQGRQKELEGKKNILYKNITDTKKDLDKAIENEKTKKSLQSKKEELERLLPISNKLKSILKDAPEFLLNRITSRISVYLTNMLHRLLPGRGYDRVEFLGDGNIVLWSGDMKVDKEVLSGGEKTVLGLALRLALADFVAPLQFLVLDEPTQNLDSQRVEEFIEIIDRDKLFTESSGQLLLVTHREEFNRNAQHSIELKIEDGKRISV